MKLPVGSLVEKRAQGQSPGPEPRARAQAQGQSPGPEPKARAEMAQGQSRGPGLLRLPAEDLLTEASFSSLVAAGATSSSLKKPLLIKALQGGLLLEAVSGVVRGPQETWKLLTNRPVPVSYTHLTLPTILRV